jgi:hypothetical protein
MISPTGSRLVGLWHALLPLAVAAALVLSASVASAVGGPDFTLPGGGVTNTSGLQISFDGRGIDGNGYRPIRVTVRTVPLAPLTADRQIRIVLKPKTYTSVGTPAISQVIELPEGNSTVEATILVPQNAIWYGMELETWEGGEKWRELSAPYLGWPNNSGYWDWTEARPAILAIDRDAQPRQVRATAVQAHRSTGADPTPSHDLPDVRTLAWLFPDPNRGATPMPTMGAAGAQPPTVNSPQVSDVAMLSQISELTRIDVVSTAELPSRWIEISQIDVAVISLEDLQHVARQRPQSLTALRDWLSTGPLLVVYGVGSDFEHLEELEGLLQLARLPESADQPPGYRGWTVPREGDNDGNLKTPGDEPGRPWPRGAGARISRSRPALRERPTSTDDGAAATANAAQSAVKPPFVLRPAHLGCVVAIGSDNPFPGQEKDWIWIFNSVSDSHWRWYQRNGFSLHRMNDDYWMFLIPGVGEAPVVSFLLLVSLFAVVIGPVNYIVLGRLGRLYLLLITVPAGAAVVTVALFGYALLTDGLGVRLRARSFTELDQRTGQAAAWSRQSYYAAVSPSGGLVFPDDATVFPLVYQPTFMGGQGRTMGQLEWDGEQRLKAGFLPSRTASQFVVQRATQTKARLVVRESGGQPPAVENQLESAIHYLLLRDSLGDYYAASATRAAAKPTLTKTDAAAAEEELRKLFKAVEPGLPRGYDPTLHNNFFTSLMRSYNWMAVDSSASQPAMAASILESSLAAASQPTKHPLDNSSYIAVVAASPGVPIGVPRARQEASLHVIRGRW